MEDQGGDPRELINAIIWVLRTGAPWCCVPEEYGSWHTVYNNFRKWTQDGVMEKIFENFAPNLKKTTQIQYVKAHQHIAGAKKMGFRKGYRKINRWTYK